VKAALYARVSTDDQTLEQQLESLRGDCSRQRWKVAAEITDTISGAKFTRRGLDELMKLVRARKIDLVVCHKLDRLGRSLPHLAQMIGEFEANGVALVIPGQGIDTRAASPVGRLQMHLLMAFAEFERSLISERTKLKLRAVQRSGKHIGRPALGQKMRKAAQEVMTALQAETGKPPTCRALALRLGISVGAAHRLRADLLA
jgi:DNA invertase Pin-like site-specific DNA recombinase